MKVWLIYGNFPKEVIAIKGSEKEAEEQLARSIYTNVEEWEIKENGEGVYVETLH